MDIITPTIHSGEEITLNKISDVGFNFVKGMGEENSIIVAGKGLESVQNWNVVKIW